MPKTIPSTPGGGAQTTRPAAMLPQAAQTDALAGRGGFVSQGSDKRRRGGPAVRLSLLHAVLTLLSFILVLPFVWMVLTSLGTLDDLGTDSWLPAGGWQFDNYNEVFRAIPFERYYWNSLFVAAWVTLLQVFTSSLAAFSFSRLDWPGRDRVFVLYLATMMLPGLVMMIPNFQIMISLRLVDTLTGLILPAAFTAFGTFLLRQFMLSIPKSLDEAAMIDGASKWRVYWDVILPLARPGLVTLAIFTFMGTYNSFFWPLVMLRSEHKYTLPIGLMYFDSPTRGGPATHLMMAAVTMAIIPMILVFVVLQKQLVKGIQLGAVKG